MIISFKSKSTEDVYHGIASREALKIPQTVWGVAVRKLDLLNGAHTLSDLKAPPGNRLEALKGALKGKWSVRVNDQFRIVFDYRDGNAFDVEILDYH